MIDQDLYFCRAINYPPFNEKWKFNKFLFKDLVCPYFVHTIYISPARWMITNIAIIFNILDTGYTLSIYFEPPKTIATSHVT